MGITGAGGHRGGRGTAAWMIAAVLALAGCASAAPNPSAAPSPSPRPSQAASETGGPTLTPVPATTPVPVATPSPPGVIAVALDVWGDTGGGARLASVYEDGRAILPVEATPGEYVLSERQLSPAGRKALVQRLAGSGLFEAGDRSVRQPPPDCCGAGESITLVRQGKRVKVSAYANHVVSPEASRFDELSTLLRGLLSWDQAGAWVDASPHPFVAASYVVWADRGTLRMAPEARPSLDVAAVHWPAGFAFATFGAPVSGSTARCGTISLELLRLVLAALHGAGVAVPADAGWSYFSVSMDDSAGERTAGLTIEPMLPDGVHANGAGCSGP